MTENQNTPPDFENGYAKQPARAAGPVPPQGYSAQGAQPAPEEASAVGGAQTAPEAGVPETGAPAAAPEAPESAATASPAPASQSSEASASQSAPAAFNSASASQPGAAPQANAPANPYAGAPVHNPETVAAANQSQKKQKKSHGWIIAIVAIVLVFLFLVVSVVSCTSMVSSVANTGAQIIDVSSDANSVAIINIDSTIQYDDTANSPEGLKQLLDEAADDSNIIAVVLRVNSGGGTATAGEEMATYVREFREETGKPVVVSSASLNASAAYEISSQANYIFVAKTSEVGSIGTAMQSADYSGLLEKLGVGVDNIVSSDSKDSSYGTRALTEEERAYYQDLVDQINAVFIENVATGRNMTIDQVKELATGLVFTGMDAVDNGLADEIGTLEDACDKAAQLAGARDYSSFDLTLSYDYDLSTLAGLLSDSDSRADIVELLKEQVENDADLK